VPLELPPLRQRCEDIDSLCRHFLEQFANAYQLPKARFSKPVYKIFSRYPWPGNIRELKNLCERLSILLAGKTIEVENLPAEFSQALTPQQAPAIDLPETGIALEALEARFIHQALHRTRGNRSKSAKLLGLSRDALVYRMQKHGLINH
ncbi:MAG: helix-turn-helix domain-containing protein, partial [Methylococcales bacterium]|nr:helix-turn-helix domain-containing protein [Methylococcales bacterium]